MTGLCRRECTEKFHCPQRLSLDNRESLFVSMLSVYIYQSIHQNKGYTLLLDGTIKDEGHRFRLSYCTKERGIPARYVHLALYKVQ